MVEFVTLKEEEVKFGENNFFELASKKAVTDEGDKHFISVSRGYYKDGKDKKFTKAISIPKDGETLRKVVDVLDGFVE